MEKRIQQIMENHSISNSEVEAAIDFVQELLEFQLDETEEREPYATNAIENFKNAARLVSELKNDLFPSL